MLFRSVAQTARNLVIKLEDAGAEVEYLIRDRAAKFPPLFDEILAQAGIQVALSGIRMPQMKSIMERYKPAAASCWTAL